jgi:hypothetical protein
MADPGNCLEKIKTHKDEGITQTVGIVPYFTRLTSKPFDVYTCSKEYTRLLTYTSFFGYKSVRTEAIINEAITAEQCIELVNENNRMSINTGKFPVMKKNDSNYHCSGISHRLVILLKYVLRQRRHFQNQLVGKSSDITWQYWHHDRINGASEPDKTIKTT